MLDAHIAKNQQEKEICYQIRRTVFVEGQGIAEELDTDGLDDQAEHVIMYKDNQPAGCARLRYTENNMKLERLAVLESFRGQGLGKELMLFVDEYAKEKQVDKVIMSAQQYLEKFYNSLDYQRDGDVFTEVGIPHVKMYKEVN